MSHKDLELCVARWPHTSAFSAVVPFTLISRLSTTCLIFVIAVLCGALPASAACVGVWPAGRSASECWKSEAPVTEGTGRVYRVGPGQEFGSLGAVPWSKLKAGETVYIHYREAPYREKILISGRGTAEQWIRVLGVPGPNGELPVISGDEATTSENMRHRWTDPSIIQWLGVVHVAVSGEHEGTDDQQVPAFIEIANLQVQDALSSHRFTAENGERLAYNPFAACIYARSVEHLVVRNNILTNCGQGFYNWSGDGSSPKWWAAVQSNTIIRGNYFHNNGNPGRYTEHQLYTESNRVTIEFNRFGAQRQDAWGSQIKDRSVGTVIRYNVIEQAFRGWDIDLVEPEESWPSFSKQPELKQSFVYGNVIVSKGRESPNFIHWNEDHQAGRGRATLNGAKLFFYNNTIAIFSERSNAQPYTIFNGTWGQYDCPPGDLPGWIDIRNNIIAVFPADQSSSVPPIRLGYCGKEKFTLGTNWISPGFFHRGPITGGESTISPRSNDPGFKGRLDFSLRPDAVSSGSGADLAEEVEANSLGESFRPDQRFRSSDRMEQRPIVGKGSSLGAF